MIDEIVKAKFPIIPGCCKIRRMQTEAKRQLFKDKLIKEYGLNDSIATRHI